MERTYSLRSFIYIKLLEGTKRSDLHFILTFLENVSNKLLQPFRALFSQRHFSILHAIFFTTLTLSTVLVIFSYPFSRLVARFISSYHIISSKTMPLDKSRARMKKWRELDIQNVLFSMPPLSIKSAGLLKMVILITSNLSSIHTLSASTACPLVG